MKEKFINSSINFITKYQTCDDLKLIKLKYGLEGIYGTFIKLIIVILISILFNTLKETAYILLFYAGIRTFSYGWHAKNSLTCWISTILIYNIIPILIKSFEIPTVFGYIILAISLMSVILWSPADTPKKPLIRKNNRLKCKIISIIVVLIYSLLYLLTDLVLIKNTLIYALIIESILINPLTYKITKTQFNNYKYYKKQ